MIRQALSLKPSNANPAAKNTINLKDAPPQGGGKLTRQIGTSNLRREIGITTDSIPVEVKEPIIKTDIKENFEVYEDPVPEELPEEEVKKTNNVLDLLERKMEEKSREEDEDSIDRSRFLLTRNNSDVMSNVSEPPSEVSVVLDDDDDKYSVASSTYTRTVRASLSQIFFEQKRNDAVEAAKRAEESRKREAKRERDYLVFTSEEYFPDIFKYMRKREKEVCATSKYMTKQKEINEDMRGILIDWFHDVIREYNLERETFHLAVSIVDRVMSFLSVDKIQFQLVGTTSLMIASKYEEIFPPEIKEFAMITDNTYRVVDILKMERYLLGSLKFVVAAPTSVWFGNCFSKRLRYPERLARTLDYLLDLSLLEFDFIDYPASLIAAASCCFTNVQHEMEEVWPQKMVDDTGIRTEDFEDILKELHRLYICASTSSNLSIFNKYCENSQYSAAMLPAPTKKLRELFPSFFGPRNSPKKSQED